MGDTLPVGPCLIRNSPIDLLFSSTVAGSSLVDARSNVHAFLCVSPSHFVSVGLMCVSLDYARSETSTTTAAFIIHVHNFACSFSVVVLSLCDFPIFLLSLSSSLLCRVYHLDTTGTFPWITVYSSIHMNALFHLVSHYDSMHV
jgi:hypothetical protein